MIAGIKSRDIIQIAVASAVPNGAVTEGDRGLGVDVNDGGKTVGQGLSGIRLSDTDKVMIIEGHRPTLRLDNGGTVEALVLDLAKDVLRETSIVKGLDTECAE